MTAHWREARFEDLGAIPLQIAQLDQQIEMMEDTSSNRDLLAENARTWEDESGKVLAVLGVWPLWAGVGTAWALISGEALRYPFGLARAAKGFLAEIIERDDFWRIQATIERGHWTGRRFILWLGFQFEGMMECYGPTGLDHDLYALVRES